VLESKPARTSKSTALTTEWTHSKPLPLTAGQRYTMRIEFTGGGPNAHLHLEWESFTQEREHIPSNYLHPSLP